MARFLIFIVQTYRLLISPWMAPRCRFMPTCSEYAIEAFQTHGAWQGLGLSLRRIARCHPLGGSGIDEVPPRKPADTEKIPSKSH